MRKIQWWSCLAALFAACSPGAPARVETPADSASGTVPIDWAGPNRAALLVPVHLNGSGPYSFVLDTGATFTCVDAAVAQELALPPATGAIGIGAGVGSAGRVDLVRIDSIRVGAASAESLQACSIDLSAAERIGVEFDGLLGLNFLRYFHLSIDFERDVVVLRAPGDG